MTSYMSVVSRLYLVSAVCSVLGALSLWIVGHTEGTAGIAGLMKASLAMKHGMIPPNLHFHEFNLVVKPFCNNLDLVSSLRPWPEVPDGQPRRASVNSFGR